MTTTPALEPRERLEATALRALLALPSRAQLRLSGGRAVQLDGQTLHPEVQLTLKLLAATATSPADLTPERARADIKRSARIVRGAPPEMARVQERTVAGAAGPLRARLYVPFERAADARSPLLVFFHGGGWVVGDLDSHDGPCRMLAEHGGVRVLAVDYRLSPGHRFPAPVDDALAAFRDAVASAEQLGADPQRVAVGGDSAGGHLSAVTAQQAARDGGPSPAFQLLIYPVTDLSHKRRSYQLFREGFYLTESDMDWYSAHFVGPDQDRSDPRASPLLQSDLSGLPRAHVVTAGFDPLRDEGEAYAQRLREAGVPATLRRQSGLIHGFLNMTIAGHAAREAVSEMAGVLREAL